MYKTKQQNTLSVKEKVIIRLTFNPGLPLTGFRTILSCFQQVNQTCDRDPVENQLSVSGHLRKHVILMSYNLEPAIWSRDTGRRIPCFDRCQLIITWMSNIKEVHGKPRLHVCQPIIWSMAAMLRDSVVVVGAVVRRTRPRAIPLAMITMRKSTHGFPFLSYISMRLRLAGRRSSANNVHPQSRPLPAVLMSICLQKQQQQQNK